MFSRLLSEILKETSEDIEEIEYLTDGSWRPIRDDKEKERERERSNTPEYPVVNICKLAVELGVFVFASFFSTHFCAAVVLCFTNSFKMSSTSAGIPEANGHSPAHSSSSVTGKSGSGSSVSVTGVTGGGGATAVAPAGGTVVDLTLDSSSEEEGGGAGGDSEDTEDSEDSPAPKRGRYNYDKDLVTAY